MDHNLLCSVGYVEHIEEVHVYSNIIANDNVVYILIDDIQGGGRENEPGLERSRPAASLQGSDDDGPRLLDGH